MNTFCKNCGKKADGNEKFCKACGKPLVAGEKASEKKEAPIPTYKPVKNNRWPNIVRVIIGLIIVGAIAWGAYSSSQNDTAVQTSNTAINTYNTSDTDTSTQTAVQQFQSALANATDDDTRLSILKNLALAYDRQNDTTDELATLNQALNYTTSGTVDYYYVKGNIAELQNDPSDALSDFKAAYNIDSQNYQINNELGLFYLDLSNQWVSYDDLAKGLQYEKTAYSLQVNDVSAENLAIAYYLNDNYQQTISLLLPLDINNHPTMALYLGLAYAKEKDVKDAEYYFQKAIDLGVQVPQEVNDYLNSN